MTQATDVWKITTTADAARARAAVDRIAIAGGAPALQRARFLTALTARPRHCLGQGGQWRLPLHVEQGTGGRGGCLNASLTPAGACAPEPAEDPVLTCPLPHPPARAGRRAAPPLAEALLRADQDTAAVLSLLDAQEALLRLHGDEPHQTKQGVLALHCDLEAAAHTQRELLEAEQSARAEAELYTDGLVERRGEGIDAGIGRLRQALEAVSASELEQDPDAAADTVLKPLLHDSERVDDVCPLLCHTVKPPAPSRHAQADRSPVHHEPPGNRPSRGSVGSTRRESECRERI
ncbi:hypothetical protein ABT052_30070 [Streptomyces sp. NPDC002766]|uniref:hypothetical protein n=1 Tax=unclassified Streptomyces TaxID=2593676 RepID=UPI00332C1281